jgi:hypothetical protein
LHMHKRVNGTRGAMRKNSDELRMRRKVKKESGKADSYYEAVVNSYFEFQ